MTIEVDPLFTMNLTVYIYSSRANLAWQDGSHAVTDYLSELSLANDFLQRTLMFQIIFY